MKTKFISNLTDDKIYMQLFEAGDDLQYDPYCEPEQIFDVIETAFINNRIIPDNHKNNKHYINVAKKEITANGGLQNILTYIHKNKDLVNLYTSYSLLEVDPEITSLPDIINIFQHVKFADLAQEDKFIDYVHGLL